MEAIRIQTAQNVFIEYQPASVGDRIVATLIDGVIAWCYIFLVNYSLERLNLNIGYTARLLLYSPYFFYHLISEIFMDGQSVGKRAMNLKVMKLDGSQPAVGSYLLRWLLRPIDIFFFGAVAMITIASSQKGQRLGDIAAGTSVVSTRPRQTLRDTMLPEATDDYLPLYPQAGRLSDRDVAIIKEALQAYHRGEEQDSYLIQSLTGKVEELLGVRTQQTYVEFLRTVLKDHAHLSR
jgi:uncharacterized RDD family membrane protein YckC